MGVKLTPLTATSTGYLVGSASVTKGGSLYVARAAAGTGACRVKFYDGDPTVTGRLLCELLATTNVADREDFGGNFVTFHRSLHVTITDATGGAPTGTPRAIAYIPSTIDTD